MDNFSGQPSKINFSTVQAPKVKRFASRFSSIQQPKSRPSTGQVLSDQSENSRKDPLPSGKFSRYRSLFDEQISQMLLSRQIISRQQLDQALKIQQSEPWSIRRRLETIIVEETGADRHQVMRAIALYMGSREVLEGGNFSSVRVARIRVMLKNIPDWLADELVHRLAVPIEETGGCIWLACADLSDPLIRHLAERLPAGEYEMVYCRKETLERLSGQVYQYQNEFLEIIEEMYEDLPAFC